MLAKIKIFTYNKLLIIAKSYVKIKTLFFILLVINIISMSGCIETQSINMNSGIIGLGIGSQIETNNSIHQEFITKYIARIGYKYGLLSPIYSMNTNHYNEIRIDLKSRYIMEQIAYKGLEDMGMQKESKWYNDYIRGSFEVLSIIKRRNNNQKLCKQFIQKLYIKRKLFLFDGIGCKKFGEKIWMVNQINKSLF